MKTEVKHRGILVLLWAAATILVASQAVAQGSIFGLVKNADFSVPAEGNLWFVGFLDNTDEEIRVEFCDGAGYGAGNWYDDFQNYLTEQAGNPADFIFFNPENNQGYHLELSIPNNSFQQVDVQLAPVAWPSRPDSIVGLRMDDTTALIRWKHETGMRYHVYSRQAFSNGSFFRLDNSGGNLGDPGVDDSQFVDIGVAPLIGYQYVIIAENASGSWSPHSELVSVPGSSCCVLRGDANQSGAADISDLTYLVDYMFRGGPPAVCVHEGDFDYSGFVDISDLTYFIDYFFKAGPPFPPC